MIINGGGIAPSQGDLIIETMKNLDGTPCAGKLACTVWSRGKGGDNIKVLPIAIDQLYYRYSGIISVENHV